MAGFKCDEISEAHCLEAQITVGSGTQTRNPVLYYLTLRWKSMRSVATITPEDGISLVYAQRMTTVVLAEQDASFFAGLDRVAARIEVISAFGATKCPCQPWQCRFHAAENVTLICEPRCSPASAWRKCLMT